MKAKEYLTKFEKDSERLGDKEATIEMILDFLDEIQELAKARKAQSNEAVISIFLELNQKWNTLCRIDKKKRFKRDGFIKMVRSRTADVFPWILPRLNKIIAERFNLKETPNEKNQKPAGLS